MHIMFLFVCLFVCFFFYNFVGQNTSHDQIYFAQHFIIFNPKKDSFKGGCHFHRQGVPDNTLGHRESYDEVFILDSVLIFFQKDLFQYNKLT